MICPVPSSLNFYLPYLIMLHFSPFTHSSTPLLSQPFLLSSIHPSQVVANVKSLDQIGKAGAKDIMDYFVTQFGAVDSPSFKKAQTAFIRSMAGYAVVCYLLRIKVFQPMFREILILYCIVFCAQIFCFFIVSRFIRFSTCSKNLIIWLMYFLLQSSSTYRTATMAIFWLIILVTLFTLTTASSSAYPLGAI